MVIVLKPNVVKTSEYDLNTMVSNIVCLMRGEF